MLEKSTLVPGKTWMGSKTRGSKTRWKSGIQENSHELKFRTLRAGLGETAVLGETAALAAHALRYSDANGLGE